MMETVGTLALGAGALGWGFRAVEGADSLRTLAAVGKGLAWAPCLANFAGTAPAPIKEFHRAMGEFLKAYEAQDVNRIILNARNVQEKLDALLENRAEYHNNFKGWRYKVRDFFTLRQTSTDAHWDEYLAPLYALKKQINRLEEGLTNGTGYSLEDLDSPLLEAHNFMNKEVQAHTGVAVQFAKKTVDGFANAVKDKVDEVRGVHVPQQTVQIPLTPLMQLMKSIGELRTDRTMPDYLKEDQLQMDLEVLAKSNSAFASLLSYIALRNPEGKPLLPNIDRYVTDYILMVVNHEKFNPATYTRLCQALYKFDHLQPDEPIEDPAEQAKYGEREILKEGIEKPADIRLLWQAFAYVLDLDKVSTLQGSLSVGKDTSLSEMSEKIDRTLAFLSTVRGNPEARQWMGQISKLIHQFGQTTYKMVRDELEPEEAQAVRRALHDVNRKLSAGDHEGALRGLKKLYETGPIARLAVESHKEASPLSPVEELASNFAKRASESAEPEPTPDISEATIQEKKDALVESLTFYAAFQVVDGYCGYTGTEAEEDAVQHRYRNFHTQLESITDPAQRKAKFLELLDQKLDERKELGFFSRMIGKWFSGFTVSLVEYFSRHFTNVATEQLKRMVLDPINNPLVNNHMGPLRAANNAMLSLLHAEQTWAQDELGELGTDGKQARIFGIVENQDGVSTQSLMKQVIDGAINDFLAYPSFDSVFGGAKRSVQEFGDHGIFAKALSLVARAALFIATIPAYLGLAISVFAERQAAQFCIWKMDIVNTVVNAVRDSLYKDKKYAEVFDKILLDQLREVEKLLDQEGGGSPRTLAGDKEKRLVEELVSNLFAVIDRRGQLTPGRRKTRDNLIAELSDALNQGTDDIIKGVIRDIIIFSYEAIRDEQGINRIFANTLDLAAQSMRPNDMGRLWELYSPEELEKLDADPSRPEDIQKLEVDFARRIGKFGSDGLPAPSLIIKRDLDRAFQELYKEREEETHKILERILHTTVERVVKTQVDGLLMTPQDAALKLTLFLENALLPHVQVTQSKRKEATYFEDMAHLYKKRDLEGLKKRHAQFLNQLETHMRDMNDRRGRDSRSDLQIQMLDRMINRLLEHNLRPLTAQLEEGNLQKVGEQLRFLSQVMRQEERTLAALRYNIRTQEKSVGDLVSEGAKKFVRWAADSASPAIQAYVESRLKPRAEGILEMTKDPNVFTALCRSAVREYQRWERREPATSPFKTVSSDAARARANGFEFV